MEKYNEKTAKGKRFRIKASGSFKVDKFGGFRNSQILAKEWCRKMEFLLALWEEGDKNTFRERAENFLQEDYFESPEFAELSANCPNETVRGGITRVRKIMDPTNTPSSSSAAAPPDPGPFWKPSHLTVAAPKAGNKSITGF